VDENLHEDHIPGVEARQRRDGRIDLYGSSDVEGDDSYCRPKEHVFSSADMAHWVDLGQSFHLADSFSRRVNRI